MDMLASNQLVYDSIISRLYSSIIREPDTLTKHTTTNFTGISLATKLRGKYIPLNDGHEVPAVTDDAGDCREPGKIIIFTIQHVESQTKKSTKTCFQIFNKTVCQENITASLYVFLQIRAGVIKPLENKATI